jgi:uncharacterized repeat protein (TIGR03803 family)
MAKLQGCRIVVFLLFAATAIAAPAQTFTTLVDFDFGDGAYPALGFLVQGRDGNFYGTTPYGGGFGNDAGTVFKITPSGTLTTLYDFAGTGSYLPAGGLVLAIGGNFYGTTQLGGANSGNGTVFKITPAGTLTTLHSFTGTDGFYPKAGLVQGIGGNFYGTTSLGGACGIGTVFKITPGGTLTTLHCCSHPTAELVQGLLTGKFYGTMIDGGANGFGTVYRITPSGKLTWLHSFDSTDGAYPYAGLVQTTDESFYGTTSGGGANGQGTVFKISLGATLTTLHSFDSTDGANPRGRLVLATDGNFYGTTSGGGANGQGTVFKITPAGTLTTLYNFCSQTNCTDGANPYAGLVQSTNGSFYGMTSLGGACSEQIQGCGTVFSMSVGLDPFVAFVRNSGKVGQTAEILGQGFTGTSVVSFNGTAANFVIQSDTYLTATVPQGATNGFVTVTTPGGTLQSNVMFRVTK